MRERRGRTTTRKQVPSALLHAALLVGLAIGATPAHAQLPPGTRQMIVETLEGDRDLTLAMVDSMPARLLGFRPTSEVRSFAQQIDHVAESATATVSRFVFDTRMPVLGDSTVYLTNKAALRKAVATAFDYCLRNLSQLPDSVLLQPTRVFGRDVPKWRVFLMVHSHDVWTLGSVVAYFRLNGMAPPPFEAF